MAWTHVTSTDTADITTCLSIMSTMHSYYSGVAVAEVQSTLTKNTNMELWLYSDGTNQIVAALNPDVAANKCNVHILGIGTYGSVGAIGAILMTQLKAALVRYGVNYIYGVAPPSSDSGLTTKGKAFYNALAAALTTATFYAVNDTTPTGGARHFEAVLVKPTVPINSALNPGLVFQ